MKVFAWCMSFSIVWNVKELLSCMREKKKSDVSLEWILLKAWKKGNSLFNSNCQRLPKSAENVCGLPFFKFISNDTQNSFLLLLTKTYFDIRLRPTPTNWRVMRVQIKLYHACLTSSFLYLLFGIVIIISIVKLKFRNSSKNWNIRI